MNERLKEIRKSMNMNQAEFAHLLGVGQSTLAMMEVSKRDISDRHIKTICAICKVNEHWFRTGDGEMFDERGDAFEAIAQQLNLNEFQRRMVQLIYEMPIEHQRIFRDYAVRLAKEDEQLTETEHERIERITNDYLEAHDAQQPGQMTDEQA